MLEKLGALTDIEKAELRKAVQQHAKYDQMASQGNMSEEMKAKARDHVERMKHYQRKVKDDSYKIPDWARREGGSAPSGTYTRAGQRAASEGRAPSQARPNQNYDPRPPPRNPYAGQQTHRSQSWYEDTKRKWQQEDDAHEEWMRNARKRREADERRWNSYKTKSSGGVSSGGRRPKPFEIKFTTPKAPKSKINWPGVAAGVAGLGALGAYAYLKHKDQDGRSDKGKTHKKHTF